MNARHVYEPAIAGRGSAGQCPARDIAKTPAARVQVLRVADGTHFPPSACASVRCEEVAR